MDKRAYLKDSWNILDFFIVVTGFVARYLDIANFNGLRALRVLRPLRTISKIKSLRKMVKALFLSIKMLKDSLIIMVKYLFSI